jgi:hypothetical protein
MTTTNEPRQQGPPRHPGPGVRLPAARLPPRVQRPARPGVQRLRADTGPAPGLHQPPAAPSTWNIFDGWHCDLGFNGGRIMNFNIKIIAIPAIALAAGIGLAACGTTVVQPAPVEPAATTPAATTPAAAAPAPKVIINNNNNNPAPAPVYVQPASPAPGTQGPSGVFWTAAVLSSHYKQHAQEMVTRLNQSGFDGGYWWSTADNSTLPGYWVVTSGRFSNQADASARAKLLQSSGFDGAYARCVGPRQACPSP